MTSRRTRLSSRHTLVHAEQILFQAMRLMKREGIFVTSRRWSGVLKRLAESAEWNDGGR